MKLAKAKKEDIDALGCLAGAVDTMRDGGVPPKKREKTGKRLDIL